MITGNYKKVYIVNAPDYPIMKIKKELEEEGYPYNFHFNRNADYLLDADEVWLFGDYSNESEYLTAKEKGMSIWVMG